MTPVAPTLQAFFTDRLTRWSRSATALTGSSLTSHNRERALEGSKSLTRSCTSRP